MDTLKTKYKSIEPVFFIYDTVSMANENRSIGVLVALTDQAVV